MPRQPIQFDLQTDYIELYKLLKVTGLVPTGGMARHVIMDELVELDGKIETRKGKKIRSGQIVVFDGQKVVVQ